MFLVLGKQSLPVHLLFLFKSHDFICETFPYLIDFVAVRDAKLVHVSLLILIQLAELGTYFILLLHL